MSTLKNRLIDDRLKAMKARDTFALGVLRMVLGEISTQEKAGNVSIEFNDAMVITLLRKEVKKRQDTADIYQDAGKNDRAETEISEAAFLSAYLPTPLTDAEVEALVDGEIATQGATSIRDMGKVVQAVLATSKGRVDGKTVSTLVKARLG